MEIVIGVTATNLKSLNKILDKLCVYAINIEFTKKKKKMFN